MIIFISWSSDDDKSRQLAIALKAWLPLVVPSVKPWISNENMTPGDAWSTTLLKQLRATSVGLSCITKKNQSSSWIQFEAGAIACSPGASLTPILLDLEIGDLKDPLLMFNVIKADKDGLEKLVKNTLNPLLNEPSEPYILETQFETHWPKMERKLADIVKRDGGNLLNSPVSPEIEKLNRILQILSLKEAAEQQQTLNEGDWLIEIDTSPLQGPDSPLKWLAVNDHTSVSQFADDLFALINRNGTRVRRYSYGSEWEIRSANDEVVFPPNLDSPYLVSGGAVDDVRRIGEIGIEKGIRLIVNKPRPLSELTN